MNRSQAKALAFLVAPGVIGIIVGGVAYGKLGLAWGGVAASIAIGVAIVGGLFVLGGLAAFFAWADYD